MPADTRTKSTLQLPSISLGNAYPNLHMKDSHTSLTPPSHLPHTSLSLHANLELLTRNYPPRHLKITPHVDAAPSREPRSSAQVSEVPDIRPPAASPLPASILNVGTGGARRRKNKGETGRRVSREEGRECRWLRKENRIRKEGRGCSVLC